jgi:uncharacterized protein YcbX
VVAPTGIIDQLWRYPVKSLQGEQLTSVEITDVIPGDRAWGVIDAATGQLLSAKRAPELLGGSARLDGDRAILSIPSRNGGASSEIASDDPGVHRALSAWLDRDVRLERPTPGRAATIAIDWDDGTGDEPSAGQLPVFEFATQPGWFYDSTSSLHLISTATLRHLERTVGPGSGDVRRYRPNIVVDLDGDLDQSAFVEDGWVEMDIRIGSAAAWVKKRTDRCIVITRAQPGLDRSRDALVWLAHNQDRNAGISAQPNRPGRAKIGDPIRAFA